MPRQNSRNPRQNSSRDTMNHPACHAGWRNPWHPFVLVCLDKPCWGVEPKTNRRTICLEDLSRPISAKQQLTPREASQAKTNRFGLSSHLSRFVLTKPQVDDLRMRFLDKTPVSKTKLFVEPLSAFHAPWAPKQKVLPGFVLVCLESKNASPVAADIPLKH